MSFWINFLTCQDKSIISVNRISRNYLDQSTTEKLVHAFVTSKIDFCNNFKFKIQTMTYTALNGMAPSYICDLLQVLYPNQNLCSASRGLSLVVPAYQTQACGACSFSVAAPTLWNSLPVDIKNAQSLSIFRKRLKTFIFN